MNKKEIAMLRLEEKSLSDMLSKIPNENVIDRIGLESKISEIRSQLDQTTDQLKEPTPITLTFKGKPVLGNHGILALFGSKAVNQFIDIVDKLVASQSTTLGERGRIPNRNDYQLIITSTALGSFGFQLEEYPDEQPALLDGPSPIEIALNQALALLNSTLGSDDELAENVDQLDQRTLTAIQEFLAYISDQGATCAIQFKDSAFEFSDIEQTKTSSQRLSRDNIKEEEKVMEGEIIGVLPVNRTFEFLLRDSKAVIKGKISTSIDNPDNLNNILHKPSRIKVLITRVGNGRPRYKILDVPQMMEGYDL